MLIKVTRTIDQNKSKMRGRPTKNKGQEVPSLNNEFGLINFAVVTWSLGKPEHRTEVTVSIVLIILIGIGVYKLGEDA